MEEPHAMTRRRDLNRVFERLRSRLRLAVVHGSSARESGTVIHRTHNPRDWKSYAGTAALVADSLRRSGFEQVISLAEGMGLAEALLLEGVACSWLYTGGVQGHGPLAHAAALHESLGVAYVGHPPAVAALLDDKPLFKNWLRGAGLPTAPFALWHPNVGPPPSASELRLAGSGDEVGGPWIVKPASGRASKLVHYVDSGKDLPSVLAEVHHQTGDRVLVEPYLPGRELCVAVGPPLVRDGSSFGYLDRPRVLACVERHLGAEERVFTSGDDRPIGADRIRPLDAAAEPDLASELEELGRQIFEQLDLHCLVRVDVRQNAQGETQILECNPKPDLTPSLANGRGGILALGARNRGLDYDDILLCQLMHRVALGLDHCPSSLASFGTVLGPPSASLTAPRPGAESAGTPAEPMGSEG